MSFKSVGINKYVLKFILSLTKFKLNFSIVTKITYSGSLYYYYSLSYIYSTFYRKHDFNIAFKTNLNINSFLVNTKNKVPILHKSGIYEMCCSSYKALFVFQSGRRIRNLLQKLFKIIDKYKDLHIDNTTFLSANHILSKKHAESISDFELFYHCDKCIRINPTEFSKINKAFNDVGKVFINEQ